MFVLTQHNTINPFNKDEYKQDLCPNHYYFETLEDAKKAYLQLLKMYQHIGDLDSSDQFVGMVTDWEDFKADLNSDEPVYEFSMGYYTHLNSDDKVEIVEFSLHLQEKQLKSYNDFMYCRVDNSKKSIKKKKIDFFELVDKIEKIKKKYKVEEAEDGES